MSLSHPLDRAIWNALSTQQQSFSAGADLARRFRQEIGPLAGAKNESAEAIDALAALASEDEISLLEPSPPPAPESAELVLNKLCLQMIARSLSADARTLALTPLGDEDAAEMLALAELTRPGPFRTRTHTLGRFLGVRDGGRLVAMAGERMRLDGFIEISAVCTHPDYRGRGYGATLMRAVGDRILRDGATPFLHSYADNTPAIALYRSLGFEVRTEVTHAVWRRASA